MQRIVAYLVALVVSVVALVVGIRLLADNTSMLDSVKGGAGGRRGSSRGKAQTL